MRYTHPGDFTLMLASTLKSKPKFWLYRLSTVLKSLKTLYSLPPEKIDAFLNSYDMYDHDWEEEKALIEKLGPNYALEIKRKLVDYYSVLNHLCAVGHVEKMYIPPTIDLAKSIIANQALFERRMAQDLGIQKGDRVLDIGCGRGRIASHIASFTQASVVGINLDPGQLHYAEQFAQGNGLSKQCQFKLADINELPLPFPDKSFDFAYQVQVFSLSKDLTRLLSDIHRILKPGGKFACLDWVRLPAYDEKNPQHADLMRRIKPLIGAIGTPSIEGYAKALEKAGFKVLINENASLDGLQAPLIENADKFFTGLTRWVHRLVKWKLLPSHFRLLFDRLTQDGQAFIEADRMRLVTTSHYFVAQKR